MKLLNKSVRGAKRAFGRKYRRKSRERCCRRLPKSPQVQSPARRREPWRPAWFLTMQYGAGRVRRQCRADGPLPDRAAMRTGTAPSRVQKGRGPHRLPRGWGCNPPPTCPAIGSPPTWPTCGNPENPGPHRGPVDDAQLRAGLRIRAITPGGSFRKRQEAGACRGGPPLAGVRRAAVRSPRYFTEGRVDAMVSLDPGFKPEIGGPA